MKKILMICIVSFVARPALAQDIFAYDEKEINGDKAGIFTALSVNSSSIFIKRQEGYSYTAKGSLGIVPTIGGYFQKGLGGRFSIRGAVSFGYASYGYKYAQKFDSLTENFTPEVKKAYSDYTKVKHGSAFVQPQIDLGYIFGPFKKLYLIELRAGVGFHTYLGKSDDSITSTSGAVTDGKSGYTYKYFMTEQAKYGQPDVWGTLVTNIYVGLRWQKTTSEFLNHFGLGLQATIPVFTTNAGYSQLEYKNESYQVITRERVDMGLFNFGIRLTYSFL